MTNSTLNLEKGYLASLIEKSYITSFVGVNLFNKYLSNKLREKGLLTYSSESLNNTVLNFEEKIDLKYREFIGHESISKFKNVINPEIYTLNNIKRTISYNSLKDIYNYLKSNNNDDDENDENDNLDSTQHNNLTKDKILETED